MGNYCADSDDLRFRVYDTANKDICCYLGDLNDGTEVFVRTGSDHPGEYVFLDVYAQGSDKIIDSYQLCQFEERYRSLRPVLTGRRREISELLERFASPRESIRKILAKRVVMARKLHEEHSTDIDKSYESQNRPMSMDDLLFGGEQHG